MNNKGKGNVRSYIAVVIILVAALIFMFYLLETEKKRYTAKPMTDANTTTSSVISTAAGETTTTTIAVDNNAGVTTPINVEPISNFSSTLADIIGDLGFFADYNVTTFYHGVEFTFKCNNYNTESGICSEGSALMKVNDALYPLYTYTSDDDNYLLRGEDYYIVLNDELVLLYTSHTGVSTGSARIFDLSGKQVGSFDATLLGYKLNGTLYNRLYPNFEDGRIYYYSCDNNRVTIKSAELGNYTNVELLEYVDGTCY